MFSNLFNHSTANNKQLKMVIFHRKSIMWCCAGNVEYVTAEKHEELSWANAGIQLKPRHVHHQQMICYGNIGDDFYTRKSNGHEWNEKTKSWKTFLLENERTNFSLFSALPQKFISCRQQFFAHVSQAAILLLFFV